MNPRWRISSWLAVIFGAGIATGWIASDHPPRTNPLDARFIPKTADRTLAEMKERLQLRPDQLQQLVPMVTAWREKVRLTESNSLHRRFELFQEMVPLLRSHLGPLQRRAYDRDVRQIERRFLHGLHQLGLTNTTNSP